MDYILFIEEFLGCKFGCMMIDGLICVDVCGESMELILSDGDLFIVDLKDINICVGIYVFNYGDESYVKCVEKIDKGYLLYLDYLIY